MPSSSLRLIAATLATSISLAVFISPVAAATTGAEDWGPFGLQLEQGDPATKPGDDFDRYVSGKWNDTAEIPADKSRILAMSKLQDQSDEQLRTILEGLQQRKWPARSPEARLAAAYTAFMDTDAIAARGLAPARPWLDRIAAVKNQSDLVELFATPGFAAPLGIGIYADEKDSTRYALNLAQTGLGLADRDYYLVDSPNNLTLRAKYADLVAFMLGKAGHADPKAGAAGVVALETELAREQWDRAVGRDPDLNYNKLTLDELAALPHGAIARQLIDRMGAGKAPYVLVAQVPPTEAEVAAAKLTPEQRAKLGGGVPATARLIEQAPLASWKDWLSFHFLSSHASVLPKEIDDANFAFFGTALSGQLQQRPRWKRGITAVESQIGELLGQIYVKRYFPPANRRAMSQLVGNLRQAMAANLTDLKWMGPETRREAQAKLAAFTTKIGAPARFKRYEGLTISATDPLANRMATERWTTDFYLARIDKPVDRSEWLKLPQEVNAYYYSTFNEIVFPAAILQPPFFNLAADPAVNYGAIGAIIGHEMGHGFDDNGSKSDGAGNLRDWWKPEDRAAFEALTGKLVDQYSAFCLFDETSKGGKACVSGKLTLGENIGDIGGLSIAYRAYHMSLRGKPAPVLAGTTGDQRFFMSWAQIWRANAREQVARRLLIIDPHAPDRVRINGVVRNFDEWYRAFNVQPGDKLYLPPEQRVRIW